MARGYSAKADILTKTRDGQDLNQIWDDFAQALANFNAGRQPLIDLLASPVDTIIDEVQTPGTERFELATEFGIPQSMRPAPTILSRAYPFDWYDLRQGYTWRFLMKSTSRQLDIVLNMALEADNALQFDQVMKSVFNNVNRQAVIDGIATPFTVVALYNADGVVPPPYKGNTFAGTHTHYLSSGANTGQVAIDPQDILDNALHIEHHGFTRAAGYNIIFLMNPADVAAGPAKYVRNTNFASGGASLVASLYDFIPSQGTNTTLQLPPGYTLVGGLAPNTFAGLEVAGTWGPYMFIQDYNIPAGYLVAAAVPGQGTALQIVGVREDDNPALRGLVLKPGDNNNYPLIDSYFIRGIGAGIRQRGAATVMKLDATGGAYTVPASMVW